jgi:hypothetical protein
MPWSVAIGGNSFYTLLPAAAIDMIMTISRCGCDCGCGCGCG